MVRFCWVVLIALVRLNEAEEYPFDSCSDSSGRFSYIGNCTTSYAAVWDNKTQTLDKSVQIRDGYIDFGVSDFEYLFYQDSGQYSCLTFTFYGWVALGFPYYNFPYDKLGCNFFGVIISTPVFNIQLLGNGHLLFYVWCSGLEWKMETPQFFDMADNLKHFLPIILSFDGQTMKAVVQGQLVALVTQGSGRRTYTPPTNKLVFGGNGVNKSNSINMAIDRVNLVPYKDSLKTAYQYLINIPARRQACKDAGFNLTNTLTCYGVFKKPYTLANANNDCWNTGKLNGFGQNGAVASFPWYNFSEWYMIEKYVARYGSYSTGYTAWLGPMTGSTAPRHNWTFTGYPKCIQITTKTSPWTFFAPQDCSGTADATICKWSFNCLVYDPKLGAVQNNGMVSSLCKNHGVCNNFQTFDYSMTPCICPPGTFGPYCENGSPTANLAWYGTNSSCPNNGGCQTGTCNLNIDQSAMWNW